MTDKCRLEMPAWVEDFLAQPHVALTTDGACMALAVALSAENVRRGTGGPFGALVVDQRSGELTGAGINLVTYSGLSVAHAEIVALSMAQSSSGDWNLTRGRALTLVATCEPCAMCFGAVPWSGVSALVCGACKEDAEQAGFDEGDKPADWAESLRRRGIAVRLGVMREDAARVLKDYRRSGGEIYHPGPDPS